MKVGLVVPHMFMHRSILPHVIFSPGAIAIDLAEGLKSLGVDVSLYSPNQVSVGINNINADLTLFEQELSGRGYDYLTLLKKHPKLYISLARQVQAELIARAYSDANNGDLDIVHIYTNEEELGMVFAKLCNKPVIFTHHDPFNYLLKYKSIMPKYGDLNWLSMSYSQRSSMPEDTNWLANIYHGISHDQFIPVNNPTNDYAAYFGRIIEPKGVHLAIAAVNTYNKLNNTSLKLKIAGKHYSGATNDSYWTTKIEPLIDNKTILYEGLINDTKQKNEFLGNAGALIVPSLFDEPFGMVSIEALACGTPVIGLDSGAIPEVINNDKVGIVAKKVLSEEGILNETATANNIAKAMLNINLFDRKLCRQEFEARFTSKEMCQNHLESYIKAIG